MRAIANMNKLLVIATIFLLFGHFIAVSDGRLDGAYSLEKLNEQIAYYKRIKSQSGEAPPVAAASDDEQVTLNIDVLESYRTTQVYSLNQDETLRFYAGLCRSGTGKAVNVTMLLINNPGWDPVIGIVEYYVVRTTPMYEDSDPPREVLCTNVDASGKASASCLIAYWPDMNDMAIIATAGPVSGITFSVHAELFRENTYSASLIHDGVPMSRKPDIDLFLASTDVKSTVALSQTISAFPAVAMRHMQEAILIHSWCTPPLEDALHFFSIESTVMSTDGQSAFTQYVCDSTYCEVGINNIAHNGNQLPSNTVVTPHLQSMKVTVRVINWGGSYDPVENDYIGHFLFQASQMMEEETTSPPP